MSTSDDIGVVIVACFIFVCVVGFINIMETAGDWYGKNKITSEYADTDLFFKQGDTSVYDVIDKKVVNGSITCTKYKLAIYDESGWLPGIFKSQFGTERISGTSICEVVS